ncbi:MAG: FAD-dependent oxidoreductase [Patescibacteria group bacterium]
MSFPKSSMYDIDVVVFGGGVAGLWLLDELRRAGIQAILLETRALGSGQTIASQGILHGGVKHLLVGRSGNFVDALKEAPRVWRDCLDGRREPDLHAVRRRADHCVMWTTRSLTSFFGAFGARVGLRAAVRRIAEEEWPLPFAGSSGNAFRIEEQVIDPASLLEAFAERNRSHLIHAGPVRFICSAAGQVSGVIVNHPNGSMTIEIRPRAVVLAAGEGNVALRDACGLPSALIRRLPLPILTVKGNLPDLNGLCLEGMHAKVIITTQRVSDTLAVWQVASEYVPPESSDVERLLFDELRGALPRFPLPDVSVGSYVVNRAEAVIEDGSRSSDVSVTKEGNVITALPTKFVLAPRLAKRVIQLLPPASAGTALPPAIASWPRPPVATYPWNS